jgi:bacteriocin biosynthesis cyclodehydratase domain-containing protein
VTDRILTLLAAGGALDDFPVAAMRALSQDQRMRLAAELAAAALARGHSDAGAATLVRRDAASVQVYGPSRVATGIADILGTSGVGRVAVSGTARTADFAGGNPARPPAGSTAPPGAGSTAPPPAGNTAPPPAGNTARPRAGRPASRNGRGQAGRPLLPDLAILVGHQSPELPAWLMRARVPHLAVSADEAIGIVGPLVRPGQTACLRCVNITRSSMDPAWPLILAQLVGRAADPPACDATLAAAVAAQAAAQALAFIDRVPHAGAAENGTLELVLPAWQWRRRTWPRHDACGCSSDSAR